MRNRHLMIASVSIGLLPWSLSWSEQACAQESEQQNIHVLPATTITAPKLKPKRRAEATSREPGPSTKLVVFPTAPLSSADVAADKIPAFTSMVTSDQIEQTHSPDIVSSMLKYIPGIATNEVTGN